MNWQLLSVLGLLVTFVLIKKILALTGESAFFKGQKKAVKIISDADPIRTKGLKK
jgi:hypothetical protein